MKKLILTVMTMAMVSLSAFRAYADEPAAPAIDNEVTAAALEELRYDRDYVAYYPGAYTGDFSQFYVDFHTLSRKLRTQGGFYAEDAAAIAELTAKCAALTQVVDNPQSTLYYIWGDHMPNEAVASADDGWDVSYDNKTFRPSLAPYLVPDQSQVKGNIIVLSGGAFTHRCNQVEGYPVAEYFQSQGYNAFVLQYRVQPYAAIDAALDLQRAIRYIRYYGSQLGIAKSDIVTAVGFSAGGMAIMNQISVAYGNITPNTFYSDYVCDAVDQVNSDLNAALPVYGVSVPENPEVYNANPNIPPLFTVLGQKDEFFASTASSSLQFLLGLNTEVSFWLAPDAGHGFGMATGVQNYVDGYTVACENWGDMAISFLDTRLGYRTKVTSKDAVDHPN